MNAFNSAQMAYAATTRPTRTVRDTEYDLFAQITARLKSATANAETDFGALVSAIHDNRQLWTCLAGNVADGSNQLPSNLRAQIFYLAEFTDDHSRKVLTRKATADVLVEINGAVMAGLRAKEMSQ